MCVYSSVPFSLTAVDSLTSTAIKMQNSSITTKVTSSSSTASGTSLPRSSLPTLRLSLSCFPSREGCRFQSLPPWGWWAWKAPSETGQTPAEKRTDQRARPGTEVTQGTRSPASLAFRQATYLEPVCYRSVHPCPCRAPLSPCASVPLAAPKSIPTCLVHAPYWIPEGRCSLLPPSGSFCSMCPSHPILI